MGLLSYRQNDQFFTKQEFIMEQNTESGQSTRPTNEENVACADVLANSVLLSMSVVNEAKQRLKKPLQQSSLTMNQWLVLKVLYLKRANTPTSVANSINADATTITRHLDSLETSELVQRSHKKTDRRVIEINLTNKGEAVAKRLYSSYEGILKGFKENLVQDEHSMWKKVEQCISKHMLDEGKAI